uniref:Uncharacterized protein n=1 Tax=Rhizophora mucronata TaxID=61149 RepID=A0A2P2Q7L2_RHIMU
MELIFDIGEKGFW